jgi:hypothetical protein
MKYRAMILQAEDELNTLETIKSKDKQKASEVAADPDAARNAEIKKTLLEAQTQLAQSRLETDTARQDSLRLYELLELLKAKYATLIEERKTQNDELIRVEGEKLDIARALVELKLELSRVMEIAEKEKFELTSTILGLKNELFETDGREQLLKVRSYSDNCVFALKMDSSG